MRDIVDERRQTQFDDEGRDDLYDEHSGSRVGNDEIA